MYSELSDYKGFIIDYTHIYKPLYNQYLPIYGYVQNLGSSQTKKPIASGSTIGLSLPPRISHIHFLISTNIIINKVC